MTDLGNITVETGPVLVAIVGFAFTILLMVLLRLHQRWHPKCVNAKQEISLTMMNMSKFLHLSAPDEQGVRTLEPHDGMSEQLGDWLVNGFTSYTVNGVEYKGINVNNYSDESVDFLDEHGCNTICDRGRNMCNIDTLLANCADSDELEPLLDNQVQDNQPTDIMKVLNHQKLTTEYLSLIKQVLIGFEWSDHTNDLIEKRTLGPIIDKVTRVHGSPIFPEALNYSEVRDLSRAEDRGKMLCLTVLCEKPWHSLYEDDLAIVKSASADLFFFSVKALVLPIALGLSVSG